MLADRAVRVFNWPMAKSCKEVCPLYQLYESQIGLTAGTVSEATQRYLRLLDQIAASGELVEDEEKQARLNDIAARLQEMGSQLGHTADMSDKITDLARAELPEIDNTCPGIILEESDRLVMGCGYFSLGSLVRLTTSIRDLRDGNIAQAQDSP